MKNFVKIKYHAYASLDFAPDAEGWVKEDKIIDPDLHPWYIKADTLYGHVARKGYKIAIGDYAGVVKEDDIYTEVWKDDRLNSGWARNAPTGGLAAAGAPDIHTTTIDSDGIETEIYLEHFSW